MDSFVKVGEVGGNSGCMKITRSSCVLSAENLGPATRILPPSTGLPTNRKMT
jgi:hypothetical protein